MILGYQTFTLNFFGIDHLKVSPNININSNLNIGLYEVPLGIQNTQGEGFNIMAIADMDSDGFADIITINSSEDSFTVHYYDPENFIYKNVQPS